MAGSLSRAQKRAVRRWSAKGLAVLAASAVLAGSADYAAALPELPGANGIASNHQAGPAPEQREGSAADQPHAIGENRNHTVPTSLKGRYPDLQPGKKQPAPVSTVQVLPQAPQTTPKGFDARTSKEIPALRTRYETTYANADGTQTTAISTTPKNFQRADGSWAPARTTLSRDQAPAGNGWRSSGDSVTSTLASKLSAGQPVAEVRLAGGQTIGWGLSGARPVAGAQAGTDTVRYAEVAPGADLELTTQPGGVKETVVLRSKSAARSFVFPLHLDGLTPRLEGRDIVLVDAQGNKKAVIPAGFMVDAVDATSSEVTYELVEQDGKPALKVTPGNDWLDAPGRVYPVRIDPTVKEIESSAALTVRDSGSYVGTSDFMVGRQSGNRAAAYLKFDVSALANHTVFGAQLQVSSFRAPSCTPRPVTVYPVTGAWTPDPSLKYPGPAIGAALTSKTFAQGYIASGSTTTKCKPAPVAFNLGAAGSALVQRWVTNPATNQGLSLRGPVGDDGSWKLFAGTGSGIANPPTLFITHSEYNASYDVLGQPKPPVLQNQDGKLQIRVKNLSATAWTPSQYYLKTVVTDLKDNQLYQYRGADLPATVARNSSVILDATIKAMSAGTGVKQYRVYFTMVKVNGPDFTTERVDPARTLIEVRNLPPIVDQLSPDNGYRTQTLTPQLWGRAFDIDAPTTGVTYSFEICEKTSAGAFTGCTSSPYQAAGNYTVPAGKLSWNKEYAWRLSAKDANGGITVSPPAPERVSLLTDVPQPEITSRLANSPTGSGDQPFDPNLGNQLVSAVDASIPVAGPELDVVRTYNSLDPRRTGVFGAGWSSKYDLKLVPEPEGSVLITYPDGQQVRFGKNPDGSYVGPTARQAALSFDATIGTWTFKDGNANAYTFSVSGKLTQIKGRWGKPMVFEYGSDGKLLRVTSQRGDNRSLTFTWNGTRIATVSTQPVDGAALKWTYTYTGDLLTSVCGPDGKCTTYGFAQGSHYRTSVTDSKPELYYRMNDDGAVAASEVTVDFGKDNGTFKNTRNNVTGGLTGSSDTAASFNGIDAPSYLELPKGAVRKNRNQSVEMWFRIISKGRTNPLFGYQTGQIEGTSTAGLPVLYVGTDGKLRGQFWHGAAAPISTTTTVDEGNWHHVALTSNGATQTLYVDGAQIGTSTGRNVDHLGMVANQVGAAYAAAPGSWPGWGTATRNYLVGAVDEVALYSRPLSADVVAAHYKLGRNASDQLTTVTQPSGKVVSSAAYDTATERIAEFTDDDGGLWKIGTPALTGGAADLRRTVEVRDPADRRYFYEYDGIGGWLLRAGVPNGLGTREEDLPPAPPPSTTPTPCNTPDPNDPQFCVVTPGSGSQDPIFEWHALDGIAVRSYEYDKSGQLTKTTNENGESATLTYDARGNNTSRTTCRSGATDCHTSYTTYPLTGLTDPLDPRWSLPTESRDGRATSATDSTARTAYTYLPQGELVTQNSTEAGTVRNTYTDGTEVGPTGWMPSGLVRTTTDARGAVTTYSYHPTGQLSKLTTPTGLATTFTYDTVGRKTSQTQISDAFPSGVTTTFTYDAASRLKTTTGPVTTDKVTGDRHQQRVTISYDDDGNMVSQESVDLIGGGDPRVTSYTFDDRNRLARQTDAGGHEVQFSYDAFGNQTAMVDANGNRYEYAYTARNQIAEVRLVDADNTDDTGYKVLRSVGYDAVGRQVRETDAMGRTTETRYYNDGLVKSRILKDFHNPDGTKRDFVLETNTYDGAGNLIRQVSDNGKTTIDYARDAAGRVRTSTLDPGGLDRRTTLTYDIGGNVLTKVETGDYSNTHQQILGLDRRTTYGYDAAGRQTSQTSWLNSSTGLTTSWTYDQRSLQTSITPPRGNESGAVKADFTTTYSYDELGRQDVATQPKVQVESDGQPAVAAAPVTTVGYDAFGLPVSAKDALGNIGTTTYDKVGQPIESSGPSYTPPGGTAITPKVKTSYDANGNIVAVTDARGATTRFGYDRQDRMIVRDQPTSTDAERAVWQYEYTGNGDVRKATDPAGGITESTYDDLDRMITSTQVERRPVTDNFVTRYTYDDGGRVVSTTSPSGAVSTVTYDTVGQPVRTTDPSNVTTNFGYDFVGRQVEQVDGLGRTQLTSYDMADRAVASSDLDAAQAVLRRTDYTVDADGNVLTLKPPVGAAVTYTYDALGRQTSQRERASATETLTTTFGYDAAGNQTRYTDGRGNSTYTKLNSLGLTESVVEPSTVAHPAAADRTWTTSYDAAGNPVKVLAPGGVTRDRVFDAAGRLTDENGTGGADAPAAARKLGYDVLGRVTSVNSIGADNLYTYNDRGQMLSATGPSGSATFTFDADGAMVRRTDAAGIADFSYTKGRLTSMTDPVSRTQQTLGYDAAGAPKTIDYGLGRVRTFEYDALGRLKKDGLKNSGGATVASVAYDFDLDDRLTAKTTAGGQGAGANTYSYDDAGRLKTWTAGGKTTSYGWDEAGNRTQVDGKTARYDERNRLITDGTSDYSYSARGTLLSKTNGSTTDAMTFDAFDRMVSQEGRGYSYDGADRPVVGNGTTMQYSGFSDEVVADGTQIYGRGLGDEIISVAQGAAQRLLLSDARGDVTGGFDPSDGTLTALPDSRSFDPFGKTLASGGMKYGVGYQGDWSDPATGQVNMGARWYDPETGTFDSRDTATYTGGPSVIANKYVYGNANPLTHTDPTGTTACKRDPKPKPKPPPPPPRPRPGGHDLEDEPDDPNGPGGGGDYPILAAPAGALPCDPPPTTCAQRGDCPPPKPTCKQRGDCDPPQKLTCKQRGDCPPPKPKPVDPALKARIQLEKVVKYTPQPNATGVTKPLYSQGNPLNGGGGSLKDLIKDVRKSVTDLYQKAVDTVGPIVKDVVQTLSDPVATAEALAKAGEWVKENKGDLGHAALDVIGLIPVVGEAADLVNAAWYAAEGDYVNAALSAASAIPIAGYAATAAKGAKYVNKGVKAVKETKTLGKAAKDAATACKCFPAGTTVATADGEKPIEDIKVGDEVWARDQVTGESRLQKVTSLFNKQADDMMTITLTDGGKVPVTTEHPFYTPDRGWVESGDLKVGDKLLQRDGKTAVIAEITRITKTTTVYNFAVANDHNYYVGASNLLVHNCPPIGSLDELVENVSDNTFFHYTDEGGLSSILKSNKLRANSKGEVFVTQGQYTADEAWTHLFAGNPDYLGRGSHVLAFDMLEGAGLRAGTQSNELIHQGSLRLGRILYAGPNIFGK